MSSSDLDGTQAQSRSPDGIADWHPERWRGWTNAEIYWDFTQRAGVYRWLNDQLVRRAGIERARRVLDVGCGTGATASAVLRKAPFDASLVGIDASPEMVEVARANSPDPRATFVCVPATSVHTAVAGPFDRVVCNAAFWQLGDPERVFAALAAVAAPGARMVFNAPAARVRGEPSPLHPFQVALARSVEAHTGRPFQPDADELEPARLAEEARHHGWRWEGAERVVYACAQRELIDLMTIPAMIGPLTEGLGADQRAAVLATAAERSDPAAAVEVPWVFFALAFRPTR